MKIINITHTDLDGIGCSIVLKSLFPNSELEYHCCSYHDVEKTISDVLDNLTKWNPFSVLTDSILSASPDSSLNDISVM